MAAGKEAESTGLFPKDSKGSLKTFASQVKFSRVWWRLRAQIEPIDWQGCRATGTMNFV